LTRVCIDSIVNYTKAPYELILVQEGDDPAITKLLQSYKAKFTQNVKPKGFAGAMNSGLSVAEGNYYCFLNNDTVMTPGWLEEMLLAFKDEKVGLVTPTYSEMEGRQVIDYNKGQQFDYVEDPLSLKGVCFLVSKMAMNKIGNWDETFGLGGGDDNDICFRMSKAGFSLVIARRSYIYHYGSASFREEFKNDADFSKKFAVTQFNKFREKWNKKEKPKIFVAIPNNGFISNQLDNCLTFWSHDPRWLVKYYKPEGLYPVDSARNQCVKAFLEGYFDYLLFIDNDIIPPISVLETLLSHDKDICGAICFSTKIDDNGINAPFPVAVRKDKEGLYKHYIGEGLDWVDATGSSCILIKRKVMEAIEHPYYFSYHKNGITSAGEDFNFCEQAKQKGFEVWVNFNLVCGHFKNMDIKNINDLMLIYGR
jgi:GT2 family glycosyltransferase